VTRDVDRWAEALAEEMLRDAVFRAQLRALLQHAFTRALTPVATAPLTPEASTPDDLIPIKPVARALNVHPATVRAMYKRGDFPEPVNLGARKILFSRPALDAWHQDRNGAHGTRFPID